GVFDFRSGWKSSHIDQALIRGVGTFHKAWFARDRSAIRIIPFGSLGRGGRRSRGGGGRVDFRVFRRRCVRIKWLLRRRVLRCSFRRRIFGCLAAFAQGWLVLGASRNEKRHEQRER